MEWQDVRAALSLMEPPFPHAAAAEARVRWDELAPFFVAEIERVAAGGSTTLDEERGEWDGLFSFAIYLAAEKRDARAYLPLTRACHCSAERAEELFGDDAGGNLGQILASVCDGDLAPLKALAEDRGAGLWCRYAAMHALTVRVIEGDGGREEALAYVADVCEREADFLRRTAPNDDGDLDEFLTWAADTSRDLGPAPMLEKIRGWLDEGLIDPSVTGIKNFERGAAMPVADCIAEAAADENNRYIGDALDEIASWYCYEVPEPHQRAGDSDWPEKPAHSIGTVVRDTPKVGRNDPCPCGSGKKFKKCCGKESPEAVADDGKDGGVGKAIAWLTSRHAKAVKTAVAAMLNDDLDASEQALLQELGDDEWKGAQINAMEWLLSEGSISVKGVRRNVAGLLLGPGGPAFTAAQRAWIEQLSRRPLRLYDITKVMPGIGMRLCDALDTEAAPLMVQERSGSEYARVGNLIGVRIMEVGSHHEISGAAYPFSRLMNASLLAELRAAVAESAAHGDDLPRFLSAIIRRNWIAQYARPLPLPTVIDSSSGDPLLLITDHYRVANWDALAAALEAEPDVEGDRAAGWVRLLECADGLTRSRVAINPGKSADRIEVFYKTQNYADQGRAWFDQLAGASVAFAGRVVSDPKGIMSKVSAGAVPSASAAPGLPPEALAEIVEKVLRRTYANWSDEPIQALGGKTPRQALATPAGRERVKGLLRSYEAGEAEQAAGQGRRVVSYDFLWQALGLDRSAE